LVNASRVAGPRRSSAGRVSATFRRSQAGARSRRQQIFGSFFGRPPGAGIFPCT